MEKANIVRWLKAVGEPFRAGDVILEVETDKATMEVEAPRDGALAQIIVAAGAIDVPVDSPIAILTGGDHAAPAAAGEPVPFATAEQLAPVGTPGVAQASGSTLAGGWIIASPLARRRARELGVELSAISGSGPRGRILEADVVRHDAKQISAFPKAGQRSAVPVPLPLAGEEGATVKKVFGTTPYRSVRVDGMRAAIARRLTQSKQMVPHFYLESEIDVSELVLLRERLSAEYAAGAPWNRKPTINDFVIRAAALALAHVPQANAVWAGDEILHFDTVDIAVAVSVENGLYTPVLRNADALSLSAISQRLAALTEAARERRLRPEEYTGGVSSVSNLGMYQVPRFSAILNPPQSSIFAIGTVTERILSKGGAAVSAPATSVTLSVDHRVMDGAIAAALLAAFRNFLERPLQLLV